MPVQFLSAPTRLVNEAIEQAVTLTVGGETAHVFDLEYVLAIAPDLSRPKDKQRIEQMLLVTNRPIDNTRLEDILRRYAPNLPKLGESTLLDRWKRYLESRDV